MYLLDANIVSELMRVRPNPQLTLRFEQHRDVCSLSAVVWDELLFGLLCVTDRERRARLENALNDLARRMPVLDFDQNAATWHAQARARLKQRGIATPFADGQIAATAAVNGLTLVTRNVRDFVIYEKLVIENWFE